MENIIDNPKENFISSQLHFFVKANEVASKHPSISSKELFLTSEGKYVPNPLPFQISLNSNRDLHIEAKRYLSCIDDPLWKKFCCELESIMGAFAVLKVWDCHLGPICSQDQNLDLYCYTEEAAHFIRQYGFIVLDWLRQYFPNLKELHVRVEAKK